jgi:hypothetical protein
MKSYPLKTACLAVLFCLFAVNPSAFAENKAQPSKSAGTVEKLLGQWRIEKVAGLALFVGLQQEQVEALPGQTLSLTTDFAEFMNEKCESPKYEFKTEKSEEFFKSRRFRTPKDLPAQVRLLEANCKNTQKLGPFILKNKKNILFVYHGVLLSAVRKK